MFLVTQIIGLAVVSYYSQEKNSLPYGLEPPEVKETIKDGWDYLLILVTSFIIAILLVFALINIKSIWFMRIWFFIVVSVALGITINVITSRFNLEYSSLIAISIAAILSYIKIFRREIILHNLTELMIYPGIAAIFVPILNIWTIILLLILISAYDIWAVWHSGVMQKMAKFQINKVKIFSGFFVPYADKTTRQKIKNLKLRYKGKNIPDSIIKRQKIKINLAILGGGDVIFPIIAAGVFLKTFGNIWSALAVILGATLSLVYLFLFAKKHKFYPAMPFLTTGIFLGMILGWFLTLL